MTKTILYDGRYVTVEIMQYTQPIEQWASYTMNDGAAVRVRTCVREILKVKDEYLPNGDPLYLVFSERVVVGEVPDACKRRTVLPIENDGPTSIN